MKRYSNFDNVSFYYDLLKIIVFGNKIDDAQKYFLSQVPSGASVLIIGGGTGKLLMDVLNSTCSGRITYLEISEKMLAAAKRRWERYAIKSISRRVEIDFRLGSVEGLNPADEFDVVFTPFVLDVIEAANLLDFMKRIDAALRSDGLWFFSDFGRGEASGLSNIMQRILMKGMLFFFRITIGLRVKQLHDFDACFSMLGYKAIQSKLFDKGFIQSKVFQKQ